MARTLKSRIKNARYQLYVKGVPTLVEFTSGPNQDEATVDDLVASLLLKYGYQIYDPTPREEEQIIHEEVDNIEALREITTLIDGMLCPVTGIGVYVFSKTQKAPDDNEKIIKPNIISPLQPGRWELTKDTRIVVIAKSGKKVNLEIEEPENDNFRIHISKIS